MTRKSFFIYLTCVAGFASSAALAQDASEPLISAAFASNVVLQNRATLRAFATCIADRYAIETQAVLREQLGIEEIRQAHPNLVDLSCFPAAWFKNKSMQIVDQLYQSLLGEALLAFEYPADGTRTLPDLRNARPLDHPVLPKIDETSLPKKYRLVFKSDWALHDVDVTSECVARQKPADVLQLSRAKPDSLQEKAVMAALRRTISDCQTTTSNFSPPEFVWRTYLTWNLYQLLDNVRPVSIEKSGTHA